jgi:hypothetical protein
VNFTADWILTAWDERRAESIGAGRACASVGEGSGRANENRRAFFFSVGTEMRWYSILPLLEPTESVFCFSFHERLSSLVQDQGNKGRKLTYIYRF